MSAVVLDDFSNLELCFNFNDFAFDSRLLVFSRIVFRVFRQVAEISCDFDSFGYLGALDKLKFFKPFFELLISFLGKNYLFHNIIYSLYCPLAIYLIISDFIGFYPKRGDYVSINFLAFLIGIFRSDREGKEKFYCYIKLLLSFESVREALIGSVLFYRGCGRVTNKSVFAHHKPDSRNGFFAIFNSFNNHERA